jgi:hypothetical protein
MASSRRRPTRREDFFELLYRPAATLVQLFMQMELDLLYRVQKARRRLPLTLRWTADRLISSHPFYDVSLIVWVCTIVGCYFVGWGYMWVFSANVFASATLAALLGGPVPSDLDPRIKPRGRVSPSGFPCIELHLATVALAVAGRAYPQPSVLIPAVLFWAILVALRLYGCTHLPHQLLLSTIIGLLSLPATNAAAAAMLPPRGVPTSVHALGAIAVGTLWVGYAALRAESNDLPFARVPRAEFERVLGDMLAADDAAVSQKRSAREVAAAAADAAEQEYEAQEGGGGGVDAEAAWREGSGGGAVRRPPAGPAGLPIGPAEGGAGSRDARGALARSMLTSMAASMGAGVAAGGRPGRPPAGPSSSNLLPPLPSALAGGRSYLYDEEEEEDGDEAAARGLPGFAAFVPSGAAGRPTADRPARDSLFYLLQAQERKAHRKAVASTAAGLGRGGGREGGGWAPLGELAAPAAGGWGVRSRRPQAAEEDGSTASYWGGVADDDDG